ncbi:MAG: Rdx family protein [Planctomycetota bacterium]
MGAAIEKAFPEAEVELIAGGGGDFIVKNGAKELWNKRRMGDEFPEHQAILGKLGG